MLNKYPFWKYVLILAILAISCIYFAPNFYPDDPAIQITGVSTAVISQADLERASKVLTDAGIQVKKTTLATKTNSGLLHLTKAEDQLLAKDIVSKAMGDIVVTLNLAQTTPKWLRSIGAQPMKRGLDLSGGVHFLLEVDMNKALDARLKVYENDVKILLRNEKIRYRSLPEFNGAIQLAFPDETTRELAHNLIRKKFNDFDIVSANQSNQAILLLTINLAKTAEVRAYSIKQNLTTVRNRVNELGVSEPIVQQQGENRIVVELPGIQDTAEARRILGKTANLEFRLAAEPGSTYAASEELEFYEGNRPSVLIERGLIITGDRVVDAKASFSEHGMPEVNIHLDNYGGELMSRATRNNIGRSMAVIFIEQHPVTKYTKQVVAGVEIDVPMQTFKEEKKIISLAIIQSSLSTQFRITGLNNQGESSELALLLRAGSLAAPMYVAEERTIGPSLGIDNITKGIGAALWGMLFISLFIMTIYRFFGLIAIVALVANIVILLALMSILGVTLTLPGIAGIVLTMGMAVDANVLIFSRIREEISAGMRVQRAINEGFSRAFTAIFDSSLITLLVGWILFVMCTGPVKGFAVTMSMGIMTSMFTAIIVTRAIVNLIFGGRHFKKLWI
ncbi:protein translocase subunit SecD [Candidatus Pseudomonas adelgestsugas]|uniref:Protein translocase subunit SecD n=1 Tax=Candidatus Pseudomonas adelgestsugas TaxID=1302376 RepID=A0ABX5R9E2_9PSED|nr:protein translocase subunit SecD [Candidatus Pseudomonas adelgestsugas]QAX82269.1 preprotein translocase subunit SecD [Candidatus Pseudomonas adelgestsugas]